MAKKIKLDLKNVSLKQLLQLDIKDLNKYSNFRQITSKLVRAVNRRIDTLGKSKLGQLSPTYTAYLNRGQKAGLPKGKGVKYTIRGKKDASVKQLFEQLKTTLNSPVSTVRGFKEYRAEMYDKLEFSFDEKARNEISKELTKKLGYPIDINNLTNKNRRDIKKSKINLDKIKQKHFNKAYKTERKFWELVRKYENYDTNYQNWTKGQSDEVLRYLQENYEDLSKKSLDEIKTIIDEKYTDLTQSSGNDARESELLDTNNSIFEDDEEF